MAAIAAGSIVIPSGALGVFETAPRPPMCGVCASAVPPAGPGLAPTNVVVAWEDGTTVSYAESANALTQLLPPTTPSLLGSRATYNAAAMTAIPAPGSRAVGPVILHGGVTDAAGNSPVTEFVTVRTPLGFLGLPLSLTQVLPG